MYTRITARSMNENVVQTLLTNRSKLNTLQQQISTGKRIDTASDDPTATTEVLSSKTSLSKIDSYKKNIDTSLSELNITSDILTNAIDVIHRARELTVTASNASSGPSELNAINSEIEQLTEHLENLANTKFGDKYLFGGLVTASAPFDENAGNIEYKGTLSTGNYERNIEINENITVKVNLAGDEVFGQYNTTTQEGLFKTLKNLSAELKTTPVNYDNIRAKLGDFDVDLKKMLNNQSYIGSTIEKLEMTKSKIDEDSFIYTQIRSNAEDIDVSKAISDLKFQEISLQTSLEVSAKVIQQTLLQYLT